MAQTLGDVAQMLNDPASLQQHALWMADRLVNEDKPTIPENEPSVSEDELSIPEGETIH